MVANPLSGALERKRRKEERAQKLAERGEILEALPRKGLSNKREKGVLCHTVLRSVKICKLYYIIT